MFKPGDIPAELPEEVKALLGKLKPEPQALQDKRKRLLAELEAQSASASGELRPVLNKLREVLQALQPQVPFQPRLSEDFTRVLESYAKGPSTPKPPALVMECMRYLQERVEAMGMGPALETVKAASTKAEPKR
jgi:hypothetical protein